MYTVKVSPFLGFLVVCFVLSKANPSGRLYDGQPVDNLRQFPHHVYIVVSESGQKCGGSILNHHWILTSASCVKHGIRLDLYFRKMHEYDVRADYFAISVNREQVFIYPTNYDDIALIKVPITLVFSENLAPVNISRLPIEALRGRFTVMPGFSDYIQGETTTCAPTINTNEPLSSTTTPSTTTTPRTTTCSTCTLPPTTASPTLGLSYGHETRTDNLKYGMFNVIENRICKRMYGGSFDEYTQLCIESWGDNPNRPCDSDYGSGLVVGWPARSELVGLFSMFSPGCESKKPSIFTFTGKYLGWIESLIHG